MSFLSKVFTFYPLLHLALCIGSFYFFMLGPNPKSFCIFLAYVYLFPVLCFRVLHLISPIKEGRDDILKPHFCSWWAGHQIQMLFMVLPGLEGILRMIPGAFSLWLRLWGAKIGKSVYWTPTIRIYDRNFLEVGDRVIFGEQCNLVSHVITPKNDEGALFMKKIIIKDGAFIGAASGIGPGVVIHENTFIKTKTDLYPNSVVTKEGIKKGKIS